MSRRPEKLAPDLKIDWPADLLTAEEIRFIADRRTQHPLRVLIAQLLINKGDNLWGKYSKDYPSSPYNRSDQDLAINLGYKEVGRTILTASIRQNDPTGLALLRSKLEVMKMSSEVDPDVLGFERGVERYKDFYNMAVKSGIRSDKPGLRSLIREKIQPPVLRITGEVKRAFSNVASWVY